MSGQKRNQWLEGDEEDEDFHSASEGSDQEDRSKSQVKSRAIKRRRIDDDLSDNDSDGYSDEETLDKSKAAELETPSVRKKSTEEAKDDRFSGLVHEDEDEEAEEERPSRSEEDATPAQTKSKAKAKKKSGVIYISRIPPFMKPQTVRTFLSPYGDIGKLFLTPEDDGTYQRRVRSGGNKKHSYVDGWVEFKSKNDAKTVATMLNGNIMGGKKGNYYHDDIWNIKYLKGFKWDDLTEQIARENKEREARLRAEISKAKRENEGFIKDIERGKMLETMETRKKERHGGVAAANTSKDTAKKPARQFKQNMVKEQRTSASQSDATGRVLSKML